MFYRNMFRTIPAIYVIGMLSCLLGYNDVSAADIIYEQDTVASKYQDFYHSYFEKADSLSETRQYDSAIFYYQIAADAFKLEENWRGYVKSLNRIAAQLYGLKQYDKMPAYLELASAVGREKLGVSHPELGATYLWYGKYYFYSEKDFDQANEAYQLALKLTEDGFGDNHRQLIDIYDALAYTNGYRLQDYYAARKYLARQLVLLDQFPEINLGQTYFMISAMSRAMDDLEKGLSYAKQALQEYMKIPKETRPFMANVYGNIANMYLELEEYEEAISNYERAVQLRIDKDGENSLQLTVYYTSMSALYEEIDEPDLAIDIGNEGLRVFRVNDIINSGDVAFLYQNIGLAYKAKGDYDKAMLLYQRALDMLLGLYGKKDIDVSYLYIFIADLFGELNEIDSALANYQRALISGLEDYNDTDPLSIPGHSVFVENLDFYELVERKAISLQAKGKQQNDIIFLKSALEHYHLADTLITLNRQSFEREGSKLFLMDHSKSIYEQAIACSYNLFQATSDPIYLASAHDFFEKSKSRMLYETVLESRKFANLPDSLAELQSQLKIDLGYNQKEKEYFLSETEVDSQRLTMLENRIFGINRQQEQLAAYIKEHYPNFNTTLPGDDLVTLEGVQTIARKYNTQIIEYFWGDTVLYAITIDPVSFSFQKINLDVELLEWLTIYAHELKEPPNDLFNEDRFIAFHTSAYEVYNKIVAPCLIADGPNELILIPDGYLSSIPFESLITQAFEQEIINYKSLDYIIKSYSIRYDHSLSLLNQNLSRPMVIEEPNILAFGFTNENELQPDQNSTSRNEPAELLGTQQEIDAISKLIGNGLFVSGTEASEVAFKENASAYDILHLAIHGIGDEKNMLGSSLVFKSEEKGYDSLYAYEMFNLNLKAQLAVLSACETGVGKLQKGEGVFNLARGFVYAGCPSVVMSLWKINDQYSAELMQDFYSGLTDSKTVDAALREAKLKYLGRADRFTAHPANWAAFVHFGNPTTFKINNGLNYLLIGSTIMLLLVGGYFIRNRKKASV